nr:TRAF-like protein [Tanacetum cinerariifolium]
MAGISTIDEEEEFGPVIYRRQRALSVQPSQKRVRSWVVDDDDRNPPPQRSVFFSIDSPDVLDCPICLYPLFTPVFQCDNGHIACFSCCSKLKTKCPFCCTPIGIYTEWSSTDTQKKNYVTVPSGFKGYSGLLPLSVCIRECISSEFEVEAEETEEVFGN